MFHCLKVKKAWIKEWAKVAAMLHDDVLAIKEDVKAGKAVEAPKNQEAEKKQEWKKGKGKGKGAK